MAHVNDTSNISGRLQRVIAKIDGECTCDNEAESAVECDTCELPYSDADREAIHEYAQWKRRRAGSMNTARIYIEAAIHSAERYDGAITEVASASEAERIIDAHEAAGCKAAKSINSKLSGLKDFWRWCEGTDHGQDDYRWVDLVKCVQPSDENPGVEPLDPEVILSNDEIIALRESASNYRDKAFIEFLADTGARITLATQMKRGDLNLDRNPPTFRPNPQGVGHKGVAVKEYVLKESARHLRIYLNEAHPDDHEDAPLFALQRGYDPEDRENGAVSPRLGRRRLRKAAEAAGIDPERARPHNLRKSAVVRMRLKHGMTWDAIQKRMEWTDTALPKMKEVYRAITNEDEIEMVASQLGYGSGSGDADDDGDEANQTTECWNCGREISTADTFCRGCGADADGEGQKHGPTIRVSTDSSAGQFAKALGFEGGPDGQLLIQLPPNAEVPESLLAPDADAD